MSDLYNLVRANRSCRGYDSNYIVKKSELLEMIDCARLTASGMSIQPLKYYLVTMEDCPEYVDIVNRSVGFGARLAHLHLPFPGTEPNAFIIICQDQDINAATDRFYEDVGIVSQTILLKATEMGLAGCMIGNFREETLKAALGLPEKYFIKLVLSVGKSIEDIRLVEMEEGDSPFYYREDNIHYVPKRKLDEVVINKQ